LWNSCEYAQRFWAKDEKFLKGHKMKSTTLIVLAAGMLVSAIVGVAIASATSITTDPIVIGLALDAGFDGDFERLESREQTTIGRVMPPSIHQSERRGILEFDISGIPYGALIEKANLNMGWYSGSNLSPRTNLYGFAGDGMLDSSDVTQTNNLIAGGLASLWMVDVGSFVQDLVDNSCSYAGFLGIETRDDTNRNYGHFKLIIDYISKPVLEVAVDIKPGACPNPVHVTSKGVLPVAILGSEDFDVTSIDASSIRLAGVGAIRSNFEDAAGTVSNGDECECSTGGPDGFGDLILKFETQKVMEAIGEFNNGDELMLELRGNLSDETRIKGSDCIIIRDKN
jgi:hypothetical protein